MTKRYPCRTETITGTKYVIKLLIDGEHRMTAYREGSREDAERYVKRMTKNSPSLTAEIIPQDWSKEVCIECGEENYWK